MQRSWFTKTLIASLLACSCALAFAGPEEDIKYRKTVMKAVGGHMGGIAAIIRGQVDHGAHLEVHAQGIAALGKIAQDIFPEGSGDGDTAAKKEIWEQPDEFKSALDKFQTASAEFLSAVQSGDQDQIGGALKELGGSCKGCHDNFRQKKK